MAGALCALYENFRDSGPQAAGAPLFDIIYTSGAGALIGLLLAAPKGGKPDEALRNVVEFGISDPIYSLLPVNYKVFRKPGPFTWPIQRLANRWKLPPFPVQPLENPQSSLGNWFNNWVEVRQAWRNAGNGGIRRLYNDVVDLWASAITPTTLTFWDEGVCDPLPFLEDLVDFPKLNEIQHDFYLNFFSPEHVPAAARAAQAPQSGTGKAMRLFANGDIHPEHVRAAFAYPFVYTPVTVGKELAFEGATWDPISFGNLLSEDGQLSQAGDIAQIETVVLVDIVSGLEEFLVRRPRNLWDAFGLSIVWPAVAHAKKEMARFKGELNRDGRHRTHGFRVRTIEFEIEKKDGAHILDWSHSNMSKMFEIGFKAGQKHWDEWQGDFVKRERLQRYPRRRLRGARQQRDRR
jgi:predicted acylesterase/phospholipase RssA